MAKVIDITEKLDFDENPKMIIAGEEIEVNADAEAMIRLMALFKNGANDLATVGEAMNLLFSEKDRKKICSIKKNGKKLNAKALMTIMQEAQNLIIGDDEPGEQ